MGQWFVKYFGDKDFEVTGHDSENTVTGKNVIVSESLVGAILKADYVLLCTPTKRTPARRPAVSKSNNPEELMEFESFVSQRPKANKQGKAWMIITLLILIIVLEYVCLNIFHQKQRLTTHRF